MSTYRYTATDPDGFVHVRHLHAKSFDKACVKARQRILWYELLLGVDHVADDKEES
jgi:hypothetical protein